MIDLKGKHAVVCGSTQGIGRACAEGLARRGATVTLVARDARALEHVARALDAGAGQHHKTVRADFADPRALQKNITEHLDRHGPCHVLVNNTGGPASGPITEATPEAFLDGFTQHVICNQLLTQTVAPGMKEAGYGRIINIVSTSVKEPIPGLGVSNTIRAAVANWAKTWADELGPFGVTVNNVLPGYTDTARLRSLIDARAQRLGISSEEVIENWRASIPLGRFAQPNEIAHVVVFLASPEASYVNGVSLPVDGGRTRSH